MKRLVSILSLLVALAAASCTHPEFAMPQLRPEPVEGQRKLAAIDTLMQSQPDSALSAILPIFESDTLAPYDRHYANLLLSEALFKNDYEQTTRPALLEAMAYFDSLASAQPKSEDFFLLSARAHYMNGVGLVEADSVVEACAEYLHTLQMMEERYSEDELIGQKAKFMALTYNRLGDLFSNMFMEEQAIYFDKMSLVYCLKAPTSVYGISKTLKSIGKHYDIINKYDSAIIYYDSALYHLPDTDNLIYRDIVSNRSFLYFVTGGDASESLRILKYTKDKASTESERLTRIFTIGNIYFMDNQYDSTIVYLDKVFADTTDCVRRLEVASCLGKIYEIKGDREKAEMYFHLLGQRTMDEFKTKTEVSQLNNLFQNYLSEKQESIFHRDKHSIFQKYAFITAVLIIAAIILIITIRYKAKKKYEQKDQQHTALVNRMQNANARLREENRRLSEATPADTPTNGIPSLDDYEALMREPACLELLGRFSKTDIVTTNSPETYAGLSLSKADEKRIDMAIERHCPNFLNRIAALHPDLGKAELKMCKYLLLGLNEPQIAVLMQNTFTSTWKKTANIRKKMGCSDIRQHLKSELFEAKKA